MKKLFLIIGVLSLLVYLFESNEDKMPTKSFVEYSEKILLTSGIWHLEDAALVEPTVKGIDLSDKEITLNLSSIGNYELKYELEKGLRKNTGKWTLSDSTLEWKTNSGKQRSGTIIEINDSLLIMEAMDINDSSKLIQSVFKKTN